MTVLPPPRRSSRGARTRGVLVSVHDDADLAARGYAAGALAHFLKHSAGRELVPAVRAALLEGWLVQLTDTRRRRFEMESARRGRLILGVSLAVALALTGCASTGKTRVSSATRCAAHGGTYDSTAKSCSYKATTMSAAQSCQAEGGYYDIGTDYCELGN